MNQIVDAALLRSPSTRGQVALVYGLAGLAAGVLIFNRSN